MKHLKFFKLIVLLCVFFSFSFTANALTFTVTVPEGTNAVYIAGSFNGWNPSSHQMTKIAENKYQIEVETSSAGLKYKYCSGPGWQYVEKTSSSGEVADRSYNANDNVAKWAAVYNPTLIPGNITITANVPANTPDGEVYIAGSFTDPTWDPAFALKMAKVSSTQYQITVPNVTVIQYKLLCGRSWDNEELTADGEPVEDRSATITSPNVTITVAQWKSVGGSGSSDVISHTFSSFAPLQGSRRVLIYLPPDYESNPEKHYPVLYMHDAQNVLETGPYGTWDVKKTLNSMHSSGKRIGIVVAIDNGAGRLKEYTPFGNSSYEGGVAEGDEYLTAIKNVVMPYINANYRTLTDRENTGIMGSSMGGLISYYAALKEHDTFGLIAPMSPSFWFCKNDLSTYVDSWSGSNKERTKFYFICGGNEGEPSMVPDMQQFYNKTKQIGFLESNMMYEVVNEAVHNEASWAAQFGRVYEFLYENPISKVENPNNFAEKIQISVNKSSLNIANLAAELIDFTLFDIAGKQIMKKTADTSFTISSLEKGVYVAKLNSANQEYSQKVIIP